MGELCSKTMQNMVFGMLQASNKIRENPEHYLAALRKPPHLKKQSSRETSGLKNKEDAEGSKEASPN